MKKFVLLLSMFFPFFIAAQTYDAIINLGRDCQVAYQLNINGLRKCALPFDSLITPHKALVGMLENKFEGFLDPDNFELVVNEQGEKYILDKKYGTRLIHDCKLQADFLDDYEIVAIKYQRRIDRFIDLITISEYPIFIRKGITQELAQQLRDILCVMRQGRPFLLVALYDELQEIACDWQIDSVTHYYLRQRQPYSWKGDAQAWQEIFNDLGLEMCDDRYSLHED